MVRRSYCRLASWATFCFAIASFCSSGALQVSTGISPGCSGNLSAAEPNPTSRAEERTELKDLDGHFPFQVPESLDDWNARAETLRMQLRVSLGLHPMPSLAPLKPLAHGRREMDGYAVENVAFESLPGVFVTGNLYAPLPSTPGTRHPAVLCPHGHWANGRFYSTSDREAKQELASGAERFESAARSPLQARCVQLARMGVIVFHYDMIGYADSQQISLQRAHGFGQHGPNPAVAPEQWLLFSPRAEGWAQNVMGLQTLNTLQSLEFLLARSDVDPQRVSITGASGGGTQTFIASALEPRFAGAYPVVMVSTGMQGGCTCENACGLRVATGNVEIAALTAPRPMGVNAANDWTRDMARDGFPELQKLYDLFGAKDRVVFQGATHFGHNYNHVTRVAMYAFMNRLFALGHEEPILERDFQRLDADELRIWDADHPAPLNGVEWEAQMLKRWAEDVKLQIDASPGLQIEGWTALIEPANRIAKTLRVEPEEHRESENGPLIVRRVRNPQGTIVGEMLKRIGKGSGENQPEMVHVGSVKEQSNPILNGWDLQLDDAFGIDLKASEQSLVKNPRPAACYTYGYNPPLFLRRLAVLLAMIDSGATEGLERVVWRAEGGYAAIVAAAAVVRPVGALAPADDGFEFDKIDSIRNEHFLPGALRYGGLAGLVKTARGWEPQ